MNDIMQYARFIILLISEKMAKIVDFPRDFWV